LPLTLREGLKDGRENLLRGIVPFLKMFLTSAIDVDTDNNFAVFDGPSNALLFLTNCLDLAPDLLSFRNKDVAICCFWEVLHQALALGKVRVFLQ
jgi:hypothetical protein